MAEKYRIAVLGIGGVGGYFGGKLAEYFGDSNEVEIIFIARGDNAKAIQTNGLRIITTDDEFIAKPTLVTNEASEIGEVDVFLICTKAYDLAESIVKYRDCIGKNTVILPLLNGVNHAETIKQILPKTEVWNGCVFIIAKLLEAGIVKVDSEIRLLQFGSNSGTPAKMNKFVKVLHESGVNVEFSTDIDKTVWEKFIFISSLATITSYTNLHVGEVVNSLENLELVTKLISEVTTLAHAKKINVAENIEEIALNRIKSSPPESTSSMHNDFKKKGKTELETLTGYVVREAELLNVVTHCYARLYEDLKKRN
jgi:2-dehydropantoate 2-reductase